jgi:hypothetical protein
MVGDPEVHPFPCSVRRPVVRRFARSLRVLLKEALRETYPISLSLQAEVIAPSSSGRPSTTSRLTFAQSRANLIRPSLHSILGAGASLTALSFHALVPFGFRLQVRKCFNHVRFNGVGFLQQGEGMHIGARVLWVLCHHAPLGG